MDVTEFEEFQRLTEGKSKSTIYHYKSSLQKFCEFHEMDPRELINEAKNYEPEDSETSHLEENPADKRLKEWYKHIRGRGVSKNSAQTYWRHMRAFYQKFGDFVTEETPSAPDYSNKKPDYSAWDVKKMVDAARSPRDRAIILMGFQAGMDPTEICRLDYKQVKHGIENDEAPIFIWKVRKKTDQQHEAPLLQDGVDALKMYVAERKKKGGEIDDDSPLFVKKNNGEERITPQTIRWMMRDIRKRIGDQIDEVQRVSNESSLNPLSPKYLRRAFGIACEKANVNRVVKEYWMGHIPPYNGAYSGNQIPKDVQLEELRKVKPYLSITTPSEKMKEEMEERIEAHEKKIEELSNKLEIYRQEVQEFITSEERFTQKLIRKVAEAEELEDVEDWVSKLTREGKPEDVEEIDLEKRG